MTKIYLNLIGKNIEINKQLNKHFKNSLKKSIDPPLTIELFSIVLNKRTAFSGIFNSCFRFIFANFLLKVFSFIQ